MLESISSPPNVILSLSLVASVLWVCTLHPYKSQDSHLKSCWYVPRSAKVSKGLGLRFQSYSLTLNTNDADILLFTMLQDTGSSIMYIPSTSCTLVRTSRN